MATENVSKLIPFVAVGADTGSVSVSKLVYYAIVNNNVPPPPPTPLRRARVALLYGKTVGSGLGPVSNVTPPTIDRAIIGEVSTCTSGTWAGALPISFAYQWYANAVAISGAINNTYTPVSGDNGKTLTCTVTASNLGSSLPVTSNGLVVSGSGSYIDLPDDAAVYAMFAAGVGASGGKAYFLSGPSYGALGLYNHDFSANPISIHGTASTTVQSMELVNTSGVTWSTFKVTGDAGVYIHDSTGSSLTFSGVVSDSGHAQGTQSGTGWSMRNLSHCTVTVTGQYDAAKIDIQGRSTAVVLIDIDTTNTILLNGLTIDNNGTDGIIGSGACNITIDGVLASNFYFGPGDHPDFIQFFNSFDLYTPCQNLVIRNCGALKGAHGMGMQGYFLEDAVNVLIDTCWFYSDVFDNAFSNSRGSGQTNHNNFAQGFADSNTGGNMITRGAAVNTTTTNNTCNAVINYAVDGVNPGYSPAVLPGTNTYLAQVAHYGVTTNLDAFIAANPSTRNYV